MIASNKHKSSILFVCLGNICRSPMAEGALKAIAAKSGLDCVVDSAGTADYHIGSAPDPRAIATARSFGVDISQQQARQLDVDDFYRFTHIFALDPANLAGIMAKRPNNATARIALMLDATQTKKGQAIADPYYGDETDFRDAWEEILLAANAIASGLSERGPAAEF